MVFLPQYYDALLIGALVKNKILFLGFYPFVIIILSSREGTLLCCCPSVCQKELCNINWLFTWYTGRNDCGQLGQGDLNRRDLPTEVPLLQGLNIVDACCGKNHTLFLTGKKYYLKPRFQKNFNAGWYI